MTPTEQPLPRSLLALVPPLLALALQWVFWGLIQPYVWFLFYPAVFVSSWIGGLRSGLIATAVSTGLVWWFFVSPPHTLVKDPRQLVPAVVFFTMGVLFAVFHDRLIKANRRAADALAASHAAHQEISRLYERTRELDELKTQFFASVSHELRTPLTLIVGPVQRMLEAPDTAEAARRDLDVVARNARTLLRHVNDLLDVSKLEAGRMKMDYVEADVTGLARFIAGHFDVLAQEMRLAYTLEIPEGLRAQVDPDKLRRVLLNLLSNAFKFTPAGGRVRLSVRAVNGRLAVEVADSGPGIPPERREAVFERFRQLEGGPTRRYGGTGLGLAIARDLVVLHGGTIDVDEAPEGGSLFRVTLPRQAPAGSDVRPMPAETTGADEVRQAVDELRARPAPLAAPAGPAGGALVLVVEDNAEMNRFICESLRPEHRVATASDGREGLRKALDLLPDLILTDVMMPEMSGDELVRAVRSHGELDRTPVLLLTAKADDDLRVRLLREGAQDYLTKPFPVEELRARVRNLVSSKRLEDELRLSEARSSGILSISADAIICIDEDQRITLFNHGAEKIFGWSKAEAIGAPHDVLVPERFRATHRQHIAGFAADPMVARRMGEREAALFGLRRNGDEFPADAAISKLDVGGRRVLTVALRDVTERRRFEAEQQFLVDVGPVLASTLDPEEALGRIARLAVRDIADFCLVDLVDEAGGMRRLEGASRDPSGARVCDLLSRIPVDAEHPLASRQPLLVERLSPDAIASLARDEEQLQLLRAADLRSVVSVPLLAAGRLLGTIVLITAASSRVLGPADLRLAEELARRAALSVENARLFHRAERAVQARDEMLGIVAHDLRNPIAAIRMQTALLRRMGTPAEHPPADVIERATLRMSRLIEDLLDVARVEAGRLSVLPTEVLAAPVVTAAVEAQRALAASKSLELELDLAPDLPSVWADRDRLLQVFENLIGNAIKFTPRGGRITVGAAPGNGEVPFRVADTGTGIAPEDLPHLFDRFWQARKATRQGAGLGLPIVKGIVEAHGGRVWVESAPGRGSTFSFTIPTAPPTPLPLRAEAPPLQAP